MINANEWRPRLGCCRYYCCRFSCIRRVLLSESASNNRPKIAINYTDVDTVSVSPSGSTTDADTGVQFSHILNDALGGMIGEDVVWSLTSASSGTINSTGYFTPQLVGVQTIEACFGVICTQESITVTPGAAVLLQTSTTEVSITADEVYIIDAYVVDQHGNEVSGETITYTPVTVALLELRSTLTMQ